ncbi:hypothetical protein TNCV_1948071 [Trichonephila clavipes]|nr:hypothetical protein TNCV_1948071 [Trichonephila clavipes]
MLLTVYFLERCGVDEEYYQCTPSCKNTCENFRNPTALCQCGPPGCFCKKGLVMRADGKCVRPNQCPDNLVALHFKYDQVRRRFVKWAQNEIAVVPDFHKRILFSDEMHFWLNGYVNKKNCRIWSEANPQVYVETPLHPEKLTVCCALWAGGILLQER